MRGISNISSSSSDNRPLQPALDNASKTIKQVANNDLAPAARLANSGDNTLQQIGKAIQDVAKFLGAAAQMMDDMQHLSSPADLSKVLKDASQMFSSAAAVADDMSKLSGKAGMSDAQKSFQDGQQSLQAAGQGLASGQNVQVAANQAANNTQAAGQSLGRGIQQSEQSQLGQKTKAGKNADSRLTSDVLRQKLNQDLSATPSSLPRVTRMNSNQMPDERPTISSARANNGNASADTSIATQSQTPSLNIPISKEQIKDKLNSFIDTKVNNILFKNLGLQPSYQGQFSRSGQAGKTVGQGVSVDDVKNFAMTGTSAYGTEGRTLASKDWSKTFGQIDKTVQGSYGTASVNGSTTAGARGRVFGDVSLKDRSAYIGAEGEAGVHATYNANYSSPRATIGGQTVGVDANATADVFAGVSGKAKIDVSLKGNEPHVAIGGEAFAGARATIQGSVGANINGTQVAEAHAKAEGWAGAGVKGNLDIGFKDGKFHFDGGIGAALGVGGSIDVGFTVDVKAIGEGIAHGVEHVVDHAVDDVKDLGKDIGHAAQNVEQAVVHTAQNVEHAVVHAAQNVEHAVEHAAKDVGHAIGGFFKKIF